MQLGHKPVVVVRYKAQQVAAEAHTLQLKHCRLWYGMEHVSIYHFGHRRSIERIGTLFHILVSQFADGFLQQFIRRHRLATTGTRICRAESGPCIPYSLCKEWLQAVFCC
jgi:hypothetical protein